MQLKVLLFGIAKDIVGQHKISMHMEKNASIKHLKDQLTDLYPGLEALKSLAFAVNEEYVDDQYQLHIDDEVVIIPPVSGG